MNKSSTPGTLKVAMAQIAPVWLQKEATIDKISSSIAQAGEAGCDLVVFGEALLPGYPFWVSLTNGALFDDKIQKELHAHYVHNSIRIEKGDLSQICDTARKFHIAVYLGMMERAENRGGHSIYCSLVYIDKEGVIRSVHRKLQPTYEERLTWAMGDGNGLRVHELGDFTVGGLNCWENWMPLPRAALYGMGENLHIAVWPGGDHNTREITRFIAKESRSFVISVSGYMEKSDFPKETPHLEQILSEAPDILANGGSCIAGPDGEWIVSPVIDKEDLIIETLHFNRVLEERQNFDPSGHYSRPDVTRLHINRERQQTVKILD